jgi:hypothetical protein
MASWRDDLPIIASDQIRVAVIGEGRRRRHRRWRRRIEVIAAPFAAIVAALVVIVCIRHRTSNPIAPTTQPSRASGSWTGG